MIFSHPKKPAPVAFSSKKRYTGGAKSVVRFSIIYNTKKGYSWQKVKAVIFDMDGTVANTLTSIAGFGNAALEAHRLKTFPVDRYRTFVGNGARYSHAPHAHCR